MQLFGPMYDKAMLWAKHPKSRYFLSGLSFAEASFFPVPPDVMLAPMCLARPSSAWKFALLATTFSALGGVLGYGIGMFAFDLIAPLLKEVGYWHKYEMVKNWFDQWGIWVVFLAGFTPIPYKVFTIAAGVANMAIVPFFIMSVLGRGGRFFLVAGLIRWRGESVEKLLKPYIERLGWATLILVVLAYVVSRVIKMN